MKSTVLRIFLCGLLLFGGLHAALAETDVYRDVLRPGGHDRNQAAKFADGRKCGMTRQHTFTDSDQFQQCMQSYGWAFDHVVQDRSTIRNQSARFIDPDNGMSCYNQGGAEICEPPQGTVKYTNKHGLNCTRTGAMSICSNL